MAGENNNPSAIPNPYEEMGNLPVDHPPPYDEEHGLITNWEETVRPPFSSMKNNADFLCE